MEIVFWFLVGATIAGLISVWICGKIDKDNHIPLYFLLGFFLGIIGILLSIIFAFILKKPDTHSETGNNDHSRTN